MFLSKQQHQHIRWTRRKKPRCARKPRLFLPFPKMHTQSCMHTVVVLVAWQSTENCICIPQLCPSTHWIRSDYFSLTLNAIYCKKSATASNNRVEPRKSLNVLEIVWCETNIIQKSTHKHMHVHIVDGEKECPEERISAQIVNLQWKPHTHLHTLTLYAKATTTTTKCFTENVSQNSENKIDDEYAQSGQMNMGFFFPNSRCKQLFPWNITKNLLLNIFFSNSMAENSICRSWKSLYGRTTSGLEFFSKMLYSQSLESFMMKMKIHNHPFC